MPVHIIREVPDAQEVRGPREDERDRDADGAVSVGEDDQRVHAKIFAEALKSTLERLVLLDVDQACSDDVDLAVPVDDAEAAELEVVRFGAVLGVEEHRA